VLEIFSPEPESPAVAELRADGLPFGITGLQAWSGLREIGIPSPPVESSKGCALCRVQHDDEMASLQVTCAGSLLGDVQTLLVGTQE
jgi:hypothetical protein